jgi:hypothetical protein
LESHEYHQRARWQILSHGSVDGQRNDRLGREEQFHQSEHRRQILRGASTYAYPDSDSNSDSDSDAHSNSYNNSKGDTDPQVSPEPKVSPHSGTSTVS